MNTDNSAIVINYRGLSQLNELITAAGSPTKLAQLLGVELRAVTDWRRAGCVSRIGALLVDSSSLLSPLFSSRDIRPDMTAGDAIKLQYHQHYVTARMRQMEFEASPEYAQTTLYYVQARLGLLEEDNGDA